MMRETAAALVKAPSLRMVTTTQPVRNPKIELAELMFAIRHLEAQAALMRERAQVVVLEIGEE